jgi:hypothetical protein
MSTVSALPGRSACVSHRFLLRALSLSLFVALLVGLSGCDKKANDPADSVSGTVKLNGESVSGMVAFVGADNKEVISPIKPDGSYVVANPPKGKCKVLVKGMLGTGPIAPPKDAGNMPKMGSGSGANPPAKYGAVNTTTLEFEVTSGKQKYDITLTP